MLALQPRERLPLGCARCLPASLPAPRGVPPAPLRSARRTAWPRSDRPTGQRGAGLPRPRAGVPAPGRAPEACRVSYTRMVRQSAQPPADRSRQRWCSVALACPRRPLGCQATGSGPPWWGHTSPNGRGSCAPTIRPQRGSGRKAQTQRPCRNREPSPARRDESLAARRAHAVKAKPCAGLRVARRLASLDSARPAAGLWPPPGRKMGWGGDRAKPGWEAGARRWRSRWSRRSALPQR